MFLAGRLYTSECVGNYFQENFPIESTIKWMYCTVYSRIVLNVKRYFFIVQVMSNSNPANKMISFISSPI